MKHKISEQCKIELLKRLREETGCGMRDCAEALEQCDYDFEKAKEYTRQLGLAIVRK